MIRIINSKRSVALLVALCVLCVSCFTVPVHAIGIETVAIPAIQAIVSEMIGMGLERTGGNDAMTAFAQNICQLPEMASYIVQNGSDYFVNAFKQGSLLFLPYAMISLVRDRLFAKGVFSAQDPVITGRSFGTYTGNVSISYYNNQNKSNYTKSITDATGKAYTIVLVQQLATNSYNDTQFVVFKCSLENVWGVSSSLNTSGIYCISTTNINGAISSFDPIMPMYNGVGYTDSSKLKDYITSISSGCTLESAYQSDYTLGVTAPYETSISEGYATWASGAITVPNSDTGEDETFYPVGVGSTLEGTLGLTQEQVWSGVTDITTETTDIATNVQSMKGTLSDVLESVNSISDVFTTTQTVSLPLTALHFDELFTLFPFSIPKDLVDCIGFWNAEAAAPTISVPLPKTSGGFGIQKYDVPFEDIPTASAIVAILRAGQIILFCVGLLVVTRKITKW